MSPEADEATILRTAARWLREGHKAALGTVVSVSGSAPRQPGSHVAIRDDGAFAGSVSAGCVENAVIEEAFAAIAERRHRRVSFGVSDDGGFIVGLMCGGEIEIVIEPLADTAEIDAVIAAQQACRPLVRALDLDSGQSLLIDPADAHSALARQAAVAVRADAGGRLRQEGRDWFLTVYNPPRELVIVGAVHIAQALVPLAAAAGYRVRMIDPRAAYSTDERFPGVPLERTWPEDALARKPLTRRSAIVVLAHDPKIDDPALAAALRSPAFYIGALGSVRTNARRHARLSKLGFSGRQLERIHGPVGLAIGARAPVEIAIAIIGELVQCRRAPAIAGVVLAAGTSSRMGRNKLALPVGGKPMIRHVVEAALASGLERVLVVTGHEAELTESLLAGLPVAFVRNPDYAAGISTSLRAGIAAVPQYCAGAMVLLGDMPGIDAGLIDSTIAAFHPPSGRGICVASWQGTPGHPVLWARRYFDEIAQLCGDVGAKSLMRLHAADVHAVEAASDAPLSDIDTPQNLQAAMPGA